MGVGIRTEPQSRFVSSATIWESLRARPTSTRQPAGQTPPIPFFHCRPAATLLLAERVEDLCVLRKTAGVVLGVDEFSIGNDVKDAAAALDQLHLGFERLLDGGRQTGGVRSIVSFNAVCNRDLHGPMRMEAVGGVKLE